MRNANFKLILEDTQKPVVLRIYEHNPLLCQKELDIVRLIRSSVPVPEIIHAEPQGWEDVPPFVIMSYLEGVSFRDLRDSGDRDAIAEASYSAGETLAAIGRFTFPKPGWLAPGPTVTFPLLEGPDPMPRFVDSCLASPNLQARMPTTLRDCTHAMMWEHAPQLAGLGNDARLAHGDFNKRNLLVLQNAGRWQVSGVLDWEFAVSSSPLGDIGNFLRYEKASQPLVEPHFSEGYRRAGGELPHNWRYMARIFDLVALCESLCREWLPEVVAPELVELVAATTEKRHPQVK